MTWCVCAAGLEGSPRGCAACVLYLPRVRTPRIFPATYGQPLAGGAREDLHIKVVWYPPSVPPPLGPVIYACPGNPGGSTPALYLILYVSGRPAPPRAAPSVCCSAPLLSNPSARPPTRRSLGPLVVAGFYPCQIHSSHCSTPSWHTAQCGRRFASGPHVRLAQTQISFEHEYARKKEKSSGITHCGSPSPPAPDCGPCGPQRSGR